MFFRKKKALSFRQTNTSMKLIHKTFIVWTWDDVLGAEKDEITKQIPMMCKWDYTWTVVRNNLARISVMTSLLSSHWIKFRIPSWQKKITAEEFMMNFENKYAVDKKRSRFGDDNYFKSFLSSCKRLKRKKFVEKNS